MAGLKPKERESEKRNSGRRRLFVSLCFVFFVLRFFHLQRVCFSLRLFQVHIKIKRCSAVRSPSSGRMLFPKETENRIRKEKKSAERETENKNLCFFFFSNRLVQQEKGPLVAAALPEQERGRGCRAPPGRIPSDGPAPRKNGV